MLIKGNFIYTPALDELCIRPDSYILIQNGKAVQFFDEIPMQLADEEVVDYGSAIIIPAFSDLHVHAPQYINRGVGFDKELLPWLETYTFPVESRYADPVFARAGYSAFLEKMWAVGTLHFSAFATLHKESAWMLMNMTQDAGLGAYIGKVNMDRNAPDYLMEPTEKSLADTLELIEKSRSLHDVHYILTPRFVPSTTAALMDGLGKLCETYHLPVQSHLSENKNEVAWVRSLHPDIPTYTDVYREYGLMPKEQTIMAHCIHLSDQEKDFLQKNGTYLAHCAQSNADLTSGIMPLRKNLESGLNCVIASDVAGGHTLSMNRHLSMSIEVSKLHSLQNPDAKALSLGEALYLATKKSGAFFGKTGSFEEGYDFDALVIEMDEMNGLFTQTPFEKLEKFIYDGDDRDIKVRYRRGCVLECPQFD